ncbi:MAG TPA: hypothetical protein VF518_15030 [Polyangia bacterium]
MKPAGLALAALMALGAGCTAKVTIDAPDIEVTQTDLKFAAAPVGTPGGQSVKAVFQLNTSKLGASNRADAATLKIIERLDLIGVTFKAKSGIPDFAFLDRLSLTAANYANAADLEPPKPVVEILTYLPQVGDLIGATLDPPLASSPIDLLPLWRRNVLYLTVTATGALPTADWSMDLVFSLSIKLNQ